MPVQLNGATSGSITLAAPAVAGTSTVTFPAASGTAVVSGQNSAITAMTSVASTSGTSVPFTGIPSWAKRITVMLNGVKTGGTSLEMIQLGAGSATTTGYTAAAFGMAAGSTNVTTNTTGFNIITTTNAAAANLFSGNYIFNLIGSNLWSGTGIIYASNITTGFMCVGYITLSGTLDRVILTTVNGTDTFTAGTVNVMYE